MLLQIEIFINLIEINDLKFNQKKRYKMNGP